MLLDIDECSNGSHDCDVNANCTNTNGSHSCTCKEGYTGKGESCQGKIRLDLEKKHNNCSSQIIVLLSNKLAKIVFCFIQLPFANLSCSQILMNVTMIVMFVILMLTVPTQMVCIIASVSREGYIINGQSCQRRLGKDTLMSSKAAFHSKYCLRNWGYDQEAAQWFSRPDFVFLLSYGFHYTHTFTFFEDLKYNMHGYFTSCLVFFRAQKERE